MFYQNKIMLALTKELPKSYICYKFCFCEKKLDAAVAADSLGDEIVELYIFRSTQLGGDLTRTEKECVLWYLPLSVVIQREFILTELNYSLHYFGKPQFYCPKKRYFLFRQR